MSSKRLMGRRSPRFIPWRSEADPSAGVPRIESTYAGAPRAGAVVPAAPPEFTAPSRRSLPAT